MTETIQVILTFISLVFGVTFFVMWGDLKIDLRTAKEEMLEWEKYYDELRNAFEKKNTDWANVLEYNAELGNKIDLLNEELKGLKRKNRIKGKK